MKAVTVSKEFPSNLIRNYHEPGGQCNAGFTISAALSIISSGISLKISNHRFSNSCDKRYTNQIVIPSI